MQNTSRIPIITQTLMKNFFIVGVDQKTLIRQIGEQKQEELKPEVLFSMYQKKDFVKNYLQYVFPERMMVEFKPQDPKFFTFMSTDSEGFNAFFHCLIFYDEINDAEIGYESDNVDEYNKNKQFKSPVKKKTNRKTQDGGSDEEDNEQQMPNIDRKKVQKRLLQRKETCRFLDAIDLAKIKAEREQEDELRENRGDESPCVPKGRDQNKRQLDAKMKSSLKQKEFQKFTQKVLGNTIAPQMGAPGSTNPLKSLKNSLIQKSFIGPSKQNNLDRILEDKNKQQQTHSQSKEQNMSVSLRDRFKTSDEGELQLNGLVSAQSYQAPYQKAETNTNIVNNLKSSQLSMSKGGLARLNTSGNQNPNETQSSQGFGQYAKNAAGNNVFQLSNETPQSNMIHLMPCDNYFGLKKSRVLNQSHLLMDSKDNSCAVFGGQIDHEEMMRRPSQNIKMDLNSDLHNDASKDSHYQYMSNEEIHVLEQQYHQGFDNHTFNAMLSKKKYIPVAFCIETETEFHDVFREILLALFEMLRTPEPLLTGSLGLYANRLISFAELISHLAFLRTIPSPSFNTIYNIKFLNQTIVIKENAFDQIPNKSSHAIKVLLDVLDVRSIFFCWKALLFDKSLVLVSSQYSLQFYIAEALKELLFPLAWQGSYIQPGNESLIELCDGCIPMIYAQSTVFSSYDYFEGLNSTEMAICDIDASLTNELQLQALLKDQEIRMKDGKSKQLPMIHQEQMYLKLLNLLKNQRVSSYDLAFKEKEAENEDFVQNVRDTFFQMLKPYLVNIHQCIKKVDDPTNTNFYQYFDQKLYKSHFEDCEPKLKFAENLLLSSQFVHLCDDYFSDDLTNFHQMTSILKARGELSSEDLSDKYKELELKFELPQNQQEEFRNGDNDGQCPGDYPMVVNIRMPQDSHRIMLFDKIKNLIDSEVKKKTTKQTEYSPMVRKDSIKFDTIIVDIKKFYPIKMKGSYKRYQLQDQKLMQTNYQKKMFEAQRKNNVHQFSAEDYSLQRHKLGKSSNVISQQQLKMNKNQVNEKKSSDNLTNMHYNKMNIQIDKDYYEGSQEHLKEEMKIQIIPTNEFQDPQLGQQNPPPLTFPYFNNLRPVNGQKHDNQYHNEATITQSYIQMSSSNVTVLEEKEETSRKIVKLIYWKNGLLFFINELFGQIREKSLKDVNYYFVLKDQIKRLKPRRNRKTDHNRFMAMPFSNGVIIEESKEDQQSQIGTPINNKQYKHKNQYTTPASMSHESFLQNTQQKQKGAISMYGSEVTFKDWREWFKIERWDQNKHQIKGSYQYILLRLKIYEMFECMSYASDHTFFDLMDYPSAYWRFFPQTKLHQVWNSLTHDQQEQIIGEYGWKRVNTVWGYFIWKFYTSSNKNQNKTNINCSIVSSMSNGTNKSHESVFFKAHLERESSAPRNEEPKHYNTQKEKSNSSDILEKKKQIQMKAQEAKLMDITRESLKNKIKQRSQAESSGGSGGSNHEKTTPHASKFPTKAQSSDDMAFTQFSPAFSSLLSPPLRLEKTPTSDNLFSKASDIAVGESYQHNQEKYDYKKSIFYNSEVGSGTISLNCHLGGKVKKTSSKPLLLENPDTLSYGLLHKMIKFWKTNNKFLEGKKQIFKASELDRIKKELIQFDDLLQYFRKRLPDFKDDDICKQVFLLNIFNFLVLYKLAVLAVCSPEALALLKNYSMWQQFLISCSIVIAGIKIDAYLIMMYFLRPQNTPPIEFSKFMIRIQDIQADYVQYFKVKNPNKLIIFGHFLGLKGFKNLKKFKKETFDETLRQLAEDHISKKLIIKEDSKLIVADKHISWLIEDLEDNTLQGILEYFSTNVMTSKNKKFVRIAKMIIAKQESKEECEKNYVVHYKWFNWKLRPQKFKAIFDEDRV